MPNSLKSKLSSLRYKRLLTDEEYKELIKKLNGHDKEIRNKAIDEFAEWMKWEYRESIGTSAREINFACAVIDQVAERLKGGAEC